MNRFIIETNSDADAIHFLKLMGELKYIKSVTPAVAIENDKEFAAADNTYNWTNPTRPATDEEFKQMLAECEAEYGAGKYMSFEKAKEITLKTLNKCRKQKSK